MLGITGLCYGMGLSSAASFITVFLLSTNISVKPQQHHFRQGKLISNIIQESQGLWIQNMYYLFSRVLCNVVGELFCSSVINKALAYVHFNTYFNIKLSLA